jgi:hypothetical protein
MTLLLFRFGFFGVLIKLLVVAGLVGMYFYAKLSPHKDRLDAKHRKWFDTVDNIFGRMARGIGGKPYKVGEGIFLDRGQMILYLIFAAVALLIMFGL